FWGQWNYPQSCCTRPVVEAAGGLALVTVPPVRTFKGDAVKRTAFPGGIRPDRGAERTDFHGVDGTGLVSSRCGRHTDLQEKGIGTLSDIRRSAKKGKDNFFRAGGTEEARGTVSPLVHRECDDHRR